MAALNPMIKGFVAVMLITSFMMIFAITFISETNPNGLNNSNLQNYSDSMNSNLNNLTSNVDSAVYNLKTAKLSPLYLFIMFENAFYIPWSYLVFLTKSAASVPMVLFPMFGGNPAIATAITIFFTVIVATIVFLIVKAIRTGESER